MTRILTLVLALLFAPAALAQGPDYPKITTPPKTTQKPPAKLKLSADELQVMAHYKTVNAIEIDLGNAAKRQAGSQAVKAYGEMLVKDHTESNKKLAALAKKSGKTIPMLEPASAIEKQELADARANATKLEQLSGADFDREFLRMMISDHEKELAKIDAKIGDVENSELADLLKAQKPVLQRHADQARELQKSEAQAMR